MYFIDRNVISVYAQMTSLISICIFVFILKIIIVAFYENGYIKKVDKG